MMLTTNGKLSAKATTKQDKINPVTWLQRGSGRSWFEIVTDDNSSAFLGPGADTMCRGLPQAMHYLFNSMPCAYTWFHH
jgi:hypothetical protein